MRDATDDPLSFDDYEEIFTPGAPIEHSAFFIGRQQELDDLEKAIRRPGLHPIVIGNRGVGKTSLVHQAFAAYDFPVVFVTCNSTMSFDAFAKNALTELGWDTTQIEIGDEKEKGIVGKGTILGVGAETTGKEKTVNKRQGLASQTLDPWRFFLALRYFDKKVVIVLDEYDVVQAANANFHRAVAELLKTLADNRKQCDSRLVVVGVSQSAESLLGRHESIERSAREIYLRPLRREDVLDFLSHAEEQLGFRFRSAVKDAIVGNSGGYPYFVHLVGLEALDAMNRRDSTARVVEQADYEVAVRRAVNKAFRSELRKYRNALRSLTDSELQLVRELAVLSRDRAVGREDLHRRLGAAGLSSADVNDALIRLQQEKRLIYVSRNKDDVRFADPLMAPFLRIAVFPSSHSAGNGGDQMALFEE